MTKKEKALYLVHGKRYEVVIKYYITFSSNDTENVIKCNEKILNHCNVIMQRNTKKFKLFKRNIYFNKYVGGIEKC